MTIGFNKKNNEIISNFQLVPQNNNSFLTKKKYKPKSKEVTGETKLVIRYNRYKVRHTNKDKINPVITYDDFLLMVNAQCVYCGSKENITIDRIDSSKGYIIGNIQSLCKVCNVMKWNHKEIDFLSHIVNICKHKHLL